MVNSKSNSNCADCDKDKPTWGSVKLGVFVCLKCSGCHRHLGTHISFIRSINMDQWTAKQVERMRCLGNEKVNKYYLNKLKKKNKNNLIDYQSSMTVRQEFIKNKYERKLWWGDNHDNEKMEKENGKEENNEMKNEKKKKKEVKVKESEMISFKEENFNNNNINNDEQEKKVVETKEEDKVDDDEEEEKNEVVKIKKEAVLINSEEKMKNILELFPKHNVQLLNVNGNGSGFEEMKRIKSSQEIENLLSVPIMPKSKSDSELDEKKGDPVDSFFQSWKFN